MMARIIYRASTVFCTLLFIAPSMTVAAMPVNGEALLRHFVEDMQTLTATFEQTLVDADDNVVEESEGTVALGRPGRFRWTYTAPYEQLLVADGLNVWSYDADLAQVTVKPQADVLSNTPAVLLGGGGDVFEDFTLQDNFSDRGVDWLRLIPANSDGGFESVDLGFQDGTLSRMIFIDALGQSTLIALFDVEINEPVAADTFTFEVPDDVDLVGEPLTSAIAEQ